MTLDISLAQIDTPDGKNQMVAIPCTDSLPLLLNFYTDKKAQDLLQKFWRRLTRPPKMHVEIKRSALA